MHGFMQTPYVHPQNNQTYYIYEMNEKAFMILVMGFEGQEALEFKQKFADAFMKMREYIKKQQEPKQIPHEQVLALAQTVIDQNKQIEILEPKAKVYDEIANKDPL